MFFARRIAALFGVSTMRKSRPPIADEILHFKPGLRRAAAAIAVCGPVAGLLQLCLSM